MLKENEVNVARKVRYAALLLSLSAGSFACECDFIAKPRQKHKTLETESKGEMQ